MKKEELFEVSDQTFVTCTKIMVDKNHDYAGADDIDALKNFKMVEFLGVCNIQAGIMVRMCDKMARMSNLLNTPPSVSDESFEDTARDLINYTVILLAARKESQSA